MFFEHVAAFLYKGLFLYHSFNSVTVFIIKPFLEIATLGTLRLVSSKDGDGIILRGKMRFLVKIDMLHLIVVAFDIKIDRE